MHPSLRLSSAPLHPAHWFGLGALFALLVVGLTLIFLKTTYDLRMAVGSAPPLGLAALSPTPASLSQQQMRKFELFKAYLEALELDRSLYQDSIPGLLLSDTEKRRSNRAVLIEALDQFRVHRQICDQLKADVDDPPKGMTDAQLLDAEQREDTCRRALRTEAYHVLAIPPVGE